MTPPTHRPNVLIVPHRPSRLPKGLVLPLLALMVAAVGIAARCATSDWRGFSQEFSHRIGSFFAPKAKAPVLVARAETPKPVEAAPKTEATPVDKPAAVPAPSPWDDIQKSVDKLKAEREEAEQIKAKAAEDLARNPPPPPVRRGRVLMNPAQIAEIQKQRAEAIMQMQARMEEQHRRFEEMVGRRGDPMREFDDMFRRHAEAQRQFAQQFARTVPPGFGNFLPPGLGDVPAPPQPGIDLPDAPRPGRPRIQEDSGEEVRDGVRTIWRRKVIIIGGR